MRSRAGDEVLEVDGHDVRGLPLGAVHGLLLGTPGGERRVGWSALWS